MLQHAAPSRYIPPKMSPLAEIASLFLKLGFTAFGGPAAHIALMENEVVLRRKWIDRQQFLDLVSAVNFIPGPNSTELAIHIGLLRAGYLGLLTAGICFITPAMLIILPIAWLYIKYAQLPAVTGPLIAIRATMIAIIAAALFRFAQTGIKDRFTTTIAILATLAAAITTYIPRFHLPQSELIILATAALAGAFRHSPPASLPLLIPKTFFATIATLTISSKFLHLTLFFLKVGATLFGSGYILITYLRSGLVDQTHWLTPQQLTDAIAVGQFTPGPLLTTATFIGFLLGHQWSGPKGALAAAVLCTIAIFLPSFIFVALLGPLFTRHRQNPRIRSALDAMNAAVVALILVVSLSLARESLTGLFPITIAIISLILLLKFNLNSTWLILSSALLGWLLHNRGLM
jgi:chromate transporter